MLNNRAATDSRKVLYGGDAAIYSEDGTHLASVESYVAQVNVSSQPYRPLGSMQEYTVPTGYKVTLTMSEVVVEDTQFIRELYEGMHTGRMPRWTFQGLLDGYDGEEERVNYRQCVPDGNIDLQNVSGVGDIIKRQWSLAVNEPPDLQKYLGQGDES